MRQLETVLINTINDFGISGERKEGMTGVWVNDEKVAALGVRISRWVTMHGFALNVNTDLQFYDGIIPCGIFDYGVTSMAKIFGHELDMAQVKVSIIKHFLMVFDSKQVNKD
jgi:lipoyl(octanoyl) transferase